MGHARYGNLSRFSMKTQRGDSASLPFFSTRQAVVWIAMLSPFGPSSHRDGASLPSMGVVKT